MRAFVSRRLPWIAAAFFPFLSHAEESTPFELAGERIPAGSKQKIAFSSPCTFTNSALSVPVFIIHGTRPGPVLTITAGIHGDELNGVEIARRLHEDTSANDLSGTLIALPIINYHGFLSGNRYLHDRRDLNRAFPGNPEGSTASILAHEVFEKVIRRSDAVIDLHCASNRRTNLPQLRADFRHEASRDLACFFGIGAVVNGAGPEGSLRRSAVDAGIPAIIYEAGSPLRFEEPEIQRGIRGIKHVMSHLKMIDDHESEVDDSMIFHATHWVRAPRAAGGSFLSSSRPGDQVNKGDLLGKVVDPLTNASTEILAPFPGTIIGMTVPTVVFPGEALFHLGLSEKHPQTHGQSEDE